MFNRFSKCGCTSQDADHEKLHTERKCKGSAILGGPSNDFGDNADIATFYRLNDGATLPVNQKAKMSGNDARPFYKKTKEIRGFGTAPKWNFRQHLINREGSLIDCFYSNTPPKNEKVEKTMENALGKHIARETL